MIINLHFYDNINENCVHNQYYFDYNKHYVDNLNSITIQENRDYQILQDLTFNQAKAFLFQCFNDNLDKFDLIFPSNSPYITALKDFCNKK